MSVLQAELRASVATSRIIHGTPDDVLTAFETLDIQAIADRAGDTLDPRKAQLLIRALAVSQLRLIALYETAKLRDSVTPLRLVPIIGEASVNALEETHS